MLSNVGWGEILVILVLGLIIIGPERLPGVITDVKAALIAARRAINNVKRELDGELGDEFKDFKVPLSELAKLQAMGPKAVITKTLLDGDTSLFDAFNQRPFQHGLIPPAGAAQSSQAPYIRPGAPQMPPSTPPVPPVPPPPATGSTGPTGPVSFDDVT